MQSKINVNNVRSEWPADGLEPVSMCPVCGSDNRVLMHKGLTDRVFFCAPGEWAMYRCESCASSYLDPRPTPETIGLAYQHYFTHNDLPDYFTLSFYRKFRHRLANGYRNYRYGTHETPSSILGIAVAALLPVARATADSNMRHLPKAKEGARLLDLGCGSGEFLLSARDAGWDVVGVDFDSKAVEVGRQKGLDVRMGGVEVLDPSVEKFDVITLSHVIEHVHQPVEVLKYCYSLLKPDGFLWLETPNIESEGYRLFGANWLALDPPRHLVLFNLDSMQKALAIAGFSHIETQAYRPLCDESFAYSVAIEEGIDPFSVLPEKTAEQKSRVRAAERVAKTDPARREFITVKAWK